MSGRSVSRAILALCILTQLLTLRLAPATPPPTQPTALSPVWAWEVTSDIEWAEHVVGDDCCALLVATGDQHLRVLNARNGRDILDKSITVGPGVQFAGVWGCGAAGPPSGDVDRRGNRAATCFDRQAAYAVRLADGVGSLQWQHGQPLPSDATFPGDPEVLTGWVAGAATRVGLLLVDRNGQVVLLDRHAGTPRWRLKLPAMPLCRLHVADHAAAIIWKAGGRVRLALIALDARAPAPVLRDLGADWPLFSELVDGNLLTVSSQGVLLWLSTDPPQRIMGSAQSVQRARLALLRRDPDGGVGAGESASRGDVLFAGAGNQITVIPLGSARDQSSEWRIHCEEDGELLALDVAQHYLLATFERSVFARDVRQRGDVRAARLCGAGTLLSAHVGNGRLHGLFESRNAGRSILTVAGTDLDGASDVAAERAQEVQQLLGHPGERILQAIWTSRHLLLVERHAIRAYTLP